MPLTCCVIGCGNRGNREQVSFFAIPSNTDLRGREDEAKTRRRQKWINAINRSDLEGTKLKNAKVCAKHFISGKPSAVEYENHPDWAPSQHLGYGNRQLSPTASKMSRYIRYQKRNRMRILIKDEKEVNSPPLEFVAVEDCTANISGKLLSETPPENSASKIKGSTPDTCMVIDEPSFSPAKSGIKREIAAPSLEETVEKLRTVVDDSIPDDEFDRFCKSLACQLRAMPLERALICQEKLQSVMTEERLYQIGASRCGQQSDSARYDIVVKEEDLRTEEPEEYEVIVKEETDIDIDDEFP